MDRTGPSLALSAVTAVIVDKKQLGTSRNYAAERNEIEWCLRNMDDLFVDERLRKHVMMMLKERHVAIGFDDA